ncbi:DeoR family transcriptional regulator [Streptomyces inhibens]|uniref:DeoR family transcriptional regulator n=1 Tax=Streptomyces inhibens TaxID=2293571 RepID=UPI001EE7789C|nr:DeoR/GlpR family DNA-binding transcription regulator [Streptomyces inhibens]UKY51834.1 DeoR/GlpR family DNA-binding transcription regulator [Streptomyces inhibens]
MTDTEGVADVSVATDASVTELGPGDRRKRIADRVPAEGQVTIEALVQDLGVSQMTVHRDLDTLEHQGTLRKVRGGYHAAFNAFLGMSTADIARTFRADVAFLSTSAVDNGHCYHQAQENVLVERALMAAARRKVLLVDHSEFGRQALYEPAPPAGFDLVISDEQLPQEEQEALQSLGVRYELATEGSRRE